MEDLRNGILVYKQFRESGKLKCWRIIIKTVEGDLLGYAYISDNPWIKYCKKDDRVEFKAKQYVSGEKSYTVFKHIGPIQRPSISVSSRGDAEKDIRKAVSIERFARSARLKATELASKIFEIRTNHDLQTSLMTLAKVSDLWTEYILTGQIEKQKDGFDEADLLDKLLVMARPAWRTKDVGNSL